MRWFHYNAELLLTLIGLLLIGASALVGFRSGIDPWATAATAATGVAVALGLTLWLLERRRRRQRAATILAVQIMLKDVINNQLAIIMGTFRLRPPDGSPDAGDAFHLTHRSVEKIALALNNLSEESLRQWQDRYDYPPSRKSKFPARKQRLPMTR